MCIAISVSNLIQKKTPSLKQLTSYKEHLKLSIY